MALTSHPLRLLLVAAACTWAAMVSGAEQKPPSTPQDPITEIGTLSCTLIGEGDGASAGVGRDMLCRFQVGTSGPEEVYVGSVQGVGKSELLFGRGAVLLSVKAPQSTRVTPGMLAQSYAVDAAASSAFAPLIGDQRRVIVLQPLMEQEGRVAEGRTQPDAVIILVELRLQSTPA